MATANMINHGVIDDDTMATATDQNVSTSEAIKTFAENTANDAVAESGLTSNLLLMGA